MKGLNQSPQQRTAVRAMFPKDVEVELDHGGYKVKFTGLSLSELYKLAEVAKELRRTA